MNCSMALGSIPWFNIHRSMSNRYRRIEPFLSDLEAKESLASADAVALAGPKQLAGSQEGLESSGTLWEAVEGLCELGEIERAREIAAAIQLDFLKARALGLIEKHGNVSRR